MARKVSRSGKRHISKAIGVVKGTPMNFGTTGKAGVLAGKRSIGRPASARVRGG